MADYETMSKASLIEELKILEKALSSGGKADGAEGGSLLHELQVHQIELEMQNRELRDAQTALEESRDRYADLYDFAPVGYAGFDNNGIIVESNLTFASMLGVERGKLMGKPFARFVSDSNIFFSHLRQCIKSGNKVAVELDLELRDKDGITVQLISEVVAHPCSDASIRSSVTDVTERRLLYEKLMQQVDQLKTFNKLMVGRELRMGELKDENRKLRKKLEMLGGNPKK